MKPIADLHCDTLLAEGLGLWRFSAKHKRRRRPLLGHCDLEGMESGGVGFVLLGIVTAPKGGSPRSVDRALARLSRWDEGLGERFGVLGETEAIPELPEGIAALACIEGAHCLQGLNFDRGDGQSRLKEWRRRGLGAVGLAHFSSNRFAPAAAGLGADRRAPLPKDGEGLIRACVDLGLALDLAHMGDGAFLDAVELLAQLGRPPLCSHTGVGRAQEHWRNLSDEQIRALAAAGGVAGVIAAPIFLGGGSVLERMAEHLEALVDVGGISCAALGSDFDGFIVPGKELPGAWAWPRLAELLELRGWSEEDVDKVLWGNARRVLNQARGLWESP